MTRAPLRPDPVPCAAGELPQAADLRGERGQPRAAALQPSADASGGARPLDAARCERARRARDPRFDGLFFVGVRTTGVYCRPVCPAPLARPQNARFYPSAAAAAAAGLRPCRRCRPEAAPGVPAWQGTPSTVARALRLIDEGALDAAGVEALAARLGIGARQLSRLFQRHLGAGPVRVAQTRRLHLALELLEHSALPMAELARAAGYRSLRRFNEAIRAGFGRPPSALRGRPARPLGLAGELRVKLSYRPPLAWPALLDFLAQRALPGLEDAQRGRYARTIAIAGQDAPASIQLEPCGEGRLELRVRGAPTGALGSLVARVRRVFDLDADPEAIAEVLRADPVLAAGPGLAPGLRVPGAWSPFEIATRVILGQRISVAAARSIAGRIAGRLGRPLADSPEAPALFPAAEVLAEASLDGLGVPARSARAIRELARGVCQGEIDLETPGGDARALEWLQRIPGVGPWTVQMIALRLGYPDAFPAADLGLLRGAERSLGLAVRSLSAAALEARAERWRPWRAYAALELWRRYAARSEGSAPAGR